MARSVPPGDEQLRRSHAASIVFTSSARALWRRPAIGTGSQLHRSTATFTYRRVGSVPSCRWPSTLTAPSGTAVSGSWLSASARLGLVQRLRVPCCEPRLGERGQVGGVAAEDQDLLVRARLQVEHQPPVVLAKQGDPRAHGTGRRLPPEAWSVDHP